MNARTMLRRSAVLLIAVSLCAGGSAALADETAEVQIWAIRATSKNATVSPELKSLAQQLKQEFKYTGYTLVGRKSGSVKLGQTITADLPGNYKAKVSPLERKADRIKLRIEIFKKEGDRETRLTGTTLTLDRERFQILGRWKLEDGGDDVLLVAIAAR